MELLNPVNKKYVLNVVILVMICDNTVIGLGEGTILQMVINGTANATKKNEPNVFKIMLK